MNSDKTKIEYPRISGVTGLNVNCSTSSTIALLSHPGYSMLPWVVESADNDVRRNIERGDNYTWVCELPLSNAKPIMEECLAKLIRTQRPSGMWKIKNAKIISYRILRALSYTGLLEENLNNQSFRHDPFQSYNADECFIDLLVRKDIMRKPLSTDKALIKSHIENHFALQEDNGSWNSSVISTAHHVEQLIALGVSPRNSHLQHGAHWVLNTCEVEARRESSRFNDVVVGHHVFTNSDRRVEFDGATSEDPDNHPCWACCRHLALAQNGLAIRMLVSLGFSQNADVLAACDNLVEMNDIYGGFCDTLIRRKFESDRDNKKSVKHL